MTTQNLDNVKDDAPVSDPHEIVEKVRSGEYFRDMRNIYAAQYLDPMCERYFYAIYTVISLLIFLFISFALTMLFPISTPIPFFHYSNDVFEEKPIIRQLKHARDEEPNRALKRFFVEEYVSRREEYDIKTLEFNVRFIKAQSTEEMYNQWQSQMDPGNPESPISQFQRNATRKIRILNVQPNQDGTVEVIYDATVTDTVAMEEKQTRMIATIAFKYSDVTIDQITGVITPVQFIVTDFKTRRLQE